MYNYSIFLEGIMKIAISADFHLKSDESHSERYEALEYILNQLNEKGINKFIIAGDLFDKDANQYQRFEEIITKKEFGKIQIITIRGNHDINVCNKYFTAENLEIIEKPKLILKEIYGIDFYLVPYARNKKMGELLAEKAKQLKPRSWVLVGHGDWIHKNSGINAYEKGVYMPLLNADLQKYKPARTFLGHIHKSLDDNDVFIPGSPCGLDITETGKRSFILFDSISLEVERLPIETSMIFIDEVITVLPSKNEDLFINRKIDELFNKWDLKRKDYKKIIARIKVNGFSSNIQKVGIEIEKRFEGIKLYKNQKIDFSELKNSNDVEKNFVIGKVEECLSNKPEYKDINASLKNEIINQALEVIYG